VTLSLFRFAGKIERLPYLLGSLIAFFSQHLVVVAIVKPLTFNTWFLFAPFRRLVIDDISAAVLLPALAYGLIVAWVLAALAFRRAADAAVSEWIAAYAIAPIVQIPVFLFLGFAPSRTSNEPGLPTGQTAAARTSGIPVAQGVLVGIALTLSAVAVGALIFGTYGYGMFVASPFVIGAMTGYLANRRANVDLSLTLKLVAWATVLGGVALVVFALEGAVCIVLAAPLGIGVALVGGMLGRAIARRQRRSRDTISAVALLPLTFALEALLPPKTSFETVETLVVDAPPKRVWDAIVHMAPIDAPLALPFRLGVAYPVSGEIVGEGIGALRRGEFSTGTAIEQVTEWLPGRKLAFTVLNAVPAMRELSPYADVHAPHVIGYFRTTLTSFELVPSLDGGTEITERTSHQLRLDPIFYWLPLARWIIHENNARVLSHIKRQAEWTFPRP
jgi:uncharacterized membrane protein YhaH (DUF805 family)